LLPAGAAGVKVEAAMRSPEHEVYQDKIELSLDGRQVFYLFFGGAVIACLVFVVGVMVGRRVEARSHVDRGAATSAARDPLAALDQLDATAREDLSFRSSLVGGSATTEVEQAIAAIERTRAAAHAVPAPKPDPDARKPAAKPDKPAKPAAKPDRKPAREPGAEPGPEPRPEPRSKPEVAAEPAGRFTLQLSSFKDKGEAESFLATVRDAGYRAYLVEADIEGKGTFFRVRLGKYDSYQAALDAKAAFERKVQRIAYVTRL
jgi:DedD protein